ncbi:MAG: hypothetical protein KIS77_05000 [Saprospiraceae bacterium]|nr:hypothetical protein [Saprospiraceae bacterium]
MVTSAPVYDELNRLADKRLHASNYDGTSAVTLASNFNYLQSLDYTYNIRGWLTGINDIATCSAQSGDNLVDMFRMQLTYETNANGGTEQYNGNIATMQWNTHINGTCGTRQLYRFSYDGANRLTAAAHRTWSGSAWTDPARYNESGITYDLNGNIKSYNRQGLVSGTATFGTIDNLTYYFDDVARPDRLTRVVDAASATKGFKYNASATSPHYTYDLNGNLTLDKHKDLTFNYNHLNLPNSINNSADSYITLTYTADGEKLTKISPAETRNYITGIEYLGANLDAIYHAEGRCTPNGASAFHYEYTLKDHLGNARVNFRANGTAVTFLEEMHYYPFGMLMEGIGTAAVTVNKYKYNGKELNDDLGLNLSDYGARWYDAALGRWWSVDPLGDHPKQVGISPYTFTANNPIKYVDPTGMIWENPKQAERLTKSVNKRLEKIEKNSIKIQAKINKGSLSDKKLAKLEGQLAENNQKTELLNQSLSDIEAISKASETFNLTGPSKSDGTHGVIKNDKGVIQIEGSSTGLHLHEIRHVGQSIEAGGLKFNKNGQLINAATTLEEARNNEVNAYQVQYSYDGSYPAGASSLSDINPTSLMKIKSADGTAIYENLKDKK